MDENKIVCEIFKFIQRDDNYVPRNYRTIGGAWTVDSWKYNNIVVQLCDEGYTKKIITDDLNVYVFNDNVVYDKGSKELLISLYNLIFG